MEQWRIAREKELSASRKIQKQQRMSHKATDIAKILVGVVDAPDCGWIAVKADSGSKRLRQRTV